MKCDALSGCFVVSTAVQLGGMNSPIFRYKPNMEYALQCMEWSLTDETYMYTMFDYAIQSLHCLAIMCKFV